MSASQHRSVVYESGDILVRKVSAGSPLTQVVTFDHYDIGDGHDRPGFGEQFLFEQGYDALHILGRGNHWYQYEDMAAAMTAARAAIPEGARVITYGSSMGGYAALRWADAVGAHCAIAISPQYTVDPSIVPWEDRWSQDADSIAWRAEMNGPITRSAPSVVIYDSAGKDRLHAEMIVRDTAATPIRIPYASHPAAVFLAQGNLLRPLLADVMNDAFDPAAYQETVARERKNNPIYLAHLAELQPDHRPRTALAIARKAEAVAPTSTLALHSLARALARAGNYPAALDVHERLRPLIDRADVYLPSFVETLLAVGRTDEAVRVARTIVPSDSPRAHRRHWMAWVLWQSGRYDEAIAEQAEACAHEPGNARFREILERYRRKRRSLLRHPLVVKLRRAVSQARRSRLAKSAET